MPIMRVTTTALLMGQTMQNVLHFRMAGGALTFQQIAENIRDVWVTRIKTHQTTDHVYNAISVSQVGSQVATFTLPVNIPGTNIATNEGTPFECMVIQKRTALAGRHGHGRFYVGGVTTNVAQKGLLTAAVINNWTTSLNFLMSIYGTLGEPGGPLDLVIHPKGGGAEDGVDVTEMVVRPWLGVQRRRNYNVGI